MLLLRAANGGVFEVLNETTNLVIGTMVCGSDKKWHFNSHISSGNINMAPQSEIDKVLLVLNTSDNKTNSITLSDAIDNMGL